MRLAERVAVVTGDVTGLGRTFALALASEGARVVVAEARNAQSDAIAAEVRAAGGEAISIGTDLTDEVSTRALIRATLARYGRLDILVNKPAIGTIYEPRPFDEIPLAEWETQVAANLRGIFLCCRAAAAALRAQRAGKIINIVSASFDSGEAQHLHHVAAMGAIIGLTRGMASELGAFGVNVNAIAHGHSSTTDLGHESLLARQALKRTPLQEDLLGALIFLASPESDFMTGQTLRVDGGLHYR